LDTTRVQIGQSPKGNSSQLGVMKAIFSKKKYFENSELQDLIRVHQMNISLDKVSFFFDFSFFIAIVSSNLAHLDQKAGFQLARQV